jgi:hypothetical protein
MTTPKPWYKKAWRALRVRWVQVCITLLAGALVVMASSLAFAPKARARTDKTGYKFMHCDQCKTEMTYNRELEGKPCPRCRPPKTGYFRPTETSIKEGSGDKDPWRWVYLATAVEALATVGVVVYLLYLPVPDPTATYYLCNCPHCGQRTRFRQVALGGIGQCPRCKRPFRFPDEDDAVPEADFLKEQGELAAAEAADGDDE